MEPPCNDRVASSLMQSLGRDPTHKCKLTFCRLSWLTYPYYEIEEEGGANVSSMLPILLDRRIRTGRSSLRKRERPQPHENAGGVLVCVNENAHLFSAVGWYWEIDSKKLASLHWLQRGRRPWLGGLYFTWPITSLAQIIDVQTHLNGCWQWQVYHTIKRG